MVFLFDEEVLLDATDTGYALLETSDGDTDWTGFRDVVSKDFEGLPENLTDIRSIQSKTVIATNAADTRQITAEWIDGVARVRVETANHPSELECSGPVEILTEDRKTDALRSGLEDAPSPIWQVNDSDQISWQNKAYVDLHDRLHGKNARPDRPLFHSVLKDKPSGSAARTSISVPGTKDSLWFDVTTIHQNGFRTFYAVDVTAVVRAEVAQRNFVQTLAKTFAQLSIGLAIFDRNRQLALFNPALIDLTALPADFLSARPNLLSFLDRLRDNRMMPEPKNYASWRHQMADLVAAATDGRYLETWSLPSGSVYQVSGRPHPDGAVAFLFEDITAEVTLTRRFRSDLELGQSILDHMDDAIAVFSQSGVLTLSNSAYRDLWSVDPDSSFAETTILDATRHWQNLCQPTPVWGDIRDFVISSENRADWEAEIALNSGETLVCIAHPVQSGSTLVRFRAVRPDGPTGHLSGRELESAP